MKITDLDLDTFVIRDSVAEVEVHLNPSRRAIELLLKHRVRRLVETADLHARVPAWRQFAKARQGIE